MSWLGMAARMKRAPSDPAAALRRRIEELEAERTLLVSRLKGKNMIIEAMREELAEIRREGAP